MPDNALVCTSFALAEQSFALAEQGMQCKRPYLFEQQACRATHSEHTNNTKNLLALGIVRYWNKVMDWF